MEKSRSIKVLAVIGLCLLFGMSCGNNGAQTQEQKGSKNKKFTFSRDNKDAATNGNIQTAMHMFNWVKESGGTFDAASIGIEKGGVDEISKKVYSCIGKLYTVRGRVFKVEELPPGPKGTNTDWGDVLMLVPNSNSPLGASTVEFLYAGDITQIKSQGVYEATGYFVGTYESQNALGGKVEGLLFVGNSIKPI